MKIRKDMTDGDPMWDAQQALENYAKEGAAL